MKEQVPRNDTLAALALGRAKARPYMKMERQGVVRDALPVVVFGF